MMTGAVAAIALRVQGGWFLSLLNPDGLWHLHLNNCYLHVMNDAISWMSG